MKLTPLQHRLLYLLSLERDYEPRPLGAKPEPLRLWCMGHAYLLNLSRAATIPARRRALTLAVHELAAQGMLTVLESRRGPGGGFTVEITSAGQTAAWWLLDEPMHGRPEGPGPARVVTLHSWSDALIRSRLTASEHRMLLAIFSIGWGGVYPVSREEALVGTGLSRQTFKRALQRLRFERGEEILLYEGGLYRANPWWGRE